MQRPERLLRSRRKLPRPNWDYLRKAEYEGGCGVIGLCASERLPGWVLLEALKQMRNRGNGKGGGISAVGLEPAFFGVDQQLLETHYLLGIAYLDPEVRPQVEKGLQEEFAIAHVWAPTRHPEALSAYQTLPDPPQAVFYFVRPREERLRAFQQENELPREDAEDEFMYQHGYLFNRKYYASLGEKRAFVLCQGKDLLVLKMVGYGDDVIRYYGLENLRAHAWIGHHRYPTKGRVWHPGGAHPFIGLHEALVHNGDFANYASVAQYLAQRNIYPLFLTDTEVSVLVFDLLHRVYGYSLEFVIEALAPTTELDFARLPPEKQAIYRAIQRTHMHGSPDGPWFFLITQSLPSRDGGPWTYRLLGITDTSMLRPQVFALQEGEVQIGLAASEKQAIDAALETLSRRDSRFWRVADLYWNARGGSHTDGGAFLFTVTRQNGATRFLCTNKFGHPIRVPALRAPAPAESPLILVDHGDHEAQQLMHYARSLEWEPFARRLQTYCRNLEPETLLRRIRALTNLLDRRFPLPHFRRSRLEALLQDLLDDLLERALHFCRHTRQRLPFAVANDWEDIPEPEEPEDRRPILVDAAPFPAEGRDSLARFLVALRERGWKRIMVFRTRGHRFIGCGFGPRSHGIRLDVYGSPGDYLGSGMDGMELVVHATCQDQVGQILKSGRLVIYGDVGQTFLYAAKGGEVFVLGNAAGRPLINAVGAPRVVINGTCLDYLAESFMAGDPLHGGGFAIVNGIRVCPDGRIEELDTPYPGSNLFSLASGGCIYIRDPYDRLMEAQLNGGEFAPIGKGDEENILRMLEENERLFGIPVERLLEVEGEQWPVDRVYKKVRPGRVRALQAEEAWVKAEE